MALKIDHITLLVNSLAESMPYYTKLLSLLGFVKIRDYVWTDNEGFYFQFNQAHSNTNAYERYGAGMNHIGFAAPSAEFVQEVCDEMAKSGFEVPKLQYFEPGVVALFMKDPDGIRFEISYYPPGIQAVD